MQIFYFNVNILIHIKLLLITYHIVWI